jgi:lysozyme family protein
VISPNLEAAITFVVGVEGNYTNDPSDPGNWTGGAVGVGQCNGTKFGISAAAYPTIDVASLTLDEAKALYARDYWAPILGDSLPAALALIVFDAAVNSGVRQAGVWLQIGLGIATDGVIGPQTLDAVRAWTQPQVGKPLSELCIEVLAQRMVSLALDSNFAMFGVGWARRIERLAFRSATLV